jgi:hypothetical protein
MAISLPLAVEGRSTTAGATRRFFRAAVRRPLLLVLMALYVFAASCATSPAGLIAGLAVVAVFCVRTAFTLRAELRLAD